MPRSNLLDQDENHEQSSKDVNQEPEYFFNPQYSIEAVFYACHACLAEFFTNGVDKRRHGFVLVTKALLVKKVQFIEP